MPVRDGRMAGGGALRVPSLRAATPRPFRQVPRLPCDSYLMDVAPTPLHQSNVRVVGERLIVDGLVVQDATAVRLATEGGDPAQLLLHAIEVGARTLGRAPVGANPDFGKAEFDKAPRALDAEFVDRARRVAERLDKRLDEAFGPE